MKNLNILGVNSIISLLLLVFQSCTRTEPTEMVEKVDLFGAYQQRSEVPLSQIATDVEYIRLETGGDFMLNQTHMINVKDSLILFIGFKKLYVFNRSDGKFLYEISRFGNGPDEYSATTKIYDEKEDLFYVSFVYTKKDENNNPLNCAFNYEGEIEKSLAIPRMLSTEEVGSYIGSSWPLDDSLFIGYIDNPTANTSYKLAVFNHKGDVKKYYANYNSREIENTGSISFSRHKGMFFNMADTVRFFELHTDTVFSVSSQIIEPRYHIQMGDLLLPYAVRSDLGSPEYENNFYIRTMHESSRFLMFTASLNGYRHMVVYDKLGKKTFVCETSEDKEFYKYDGYHSPRCFGFVNDLDHFVPVGTDWAFYINKQDELVNTLSAIEVRRWFDQNPEKAAALPSHLKAFEDIGVEDNPVIIITKLKD